MLEPSMQELTTEQAKGLQVALHAEDASGPFSFPQASSLTKLKKAVSQAVAAGSWVLSATLPLKDTGSFLALFLMVWNALVRFERLVGLQGQLVCSDSSSLTMLRTSSAEIEAGPLSSA